MDLSRYVVLDCTSGTFFNAAHAVLIDVDNLPEGLEESINEGSDTDRCELADIYGIDLETWSPPDSREARALDAVAELLERLQETAGLDPDIQEIRTDIQADEDGNETILVSVGLVSSFDFDKPSADVGRKLNSIATTLRARSEQLKVSTVISFFKQE